MAAMAVTARVIVRVVQGLASYSTTVTMDDRQVLSRIDELVQEEESLLSRHENEGLSQDENARLAELKVQLDEAWDYLRQRRALRQHGFDPEDASLRGPGTVENYEA
jgi:Protein of unknown function (DUF2630)